MRVVLIHVKENFTPVPPTGILYIGTLLREHGHSVWVLDVNFKTEENAIEKIAGFEPDLVGFSVMTTSYKVTNEFSRRLAKAVPRAYLCWGGVHPSALPEETLKENNLDFVVYGEGERTMVEVCERLNGTKKPKGGGAELSGVRGVLFRIGTVVHKNPERPLIHDLDSLPIPDRSFLENFTWYLSPPGILRGSFYYGITTMYTSRGCPYQCIFCASKIVHGCAIRRRSVDNVLQEMRELKERWGVRGIYFNDDTFATDMKWLAEFCSKLKSSGLDMIWACQTRANYAQHFETMKMMKDAGCVQVDIGCESGSERVLKTLRKGITPGMILKSFENLKKLKMQTFATFIVGNPGETMDDIRKTEQVARHAPGGVSFLILVPYPGSPLYQMALDNKWFIDNRIVFDERWTNKQSDVPVMEASFSAEQLVRIRADLENKFFFRNNITSMMAFLTSPYYTMRAAQSVVFHPVYFAQSVRRAAQKRKVMSLWEDLYQKFNEDLRR